MEFLAARDKRATRQPVSGESLANSIPEPVTARMMRSRRIQAAPGTHRPARLTVRVVLDTIPWFRRCFLPMATRRLSLDARPRFSYCVVAALC